jgi:hypothetical protein
MEITEDPVPHTQLFNSSVSMLHKLSLHAETTTTNLESLSPLQGSNTRICTQQLPPETAGSQSWAIRLLITKQTVAEGCCDVHTTAVAAFGVRAAAAMAWHTGLCAFQCCR